MSRIDGGSNLVAAEIHYLSSSREFEIVDTNAVSFLSEVQPVRYPNPGKWGMLILLKVS